MEEYLEDKGTSKGKVLCMDDFLGKDLHTRQFKKMSNYCHRLVLYV